MLYLMAVLTFLAGILFYTFSPREDRLNMDVFQGEPFIQSFLSQHQAAKDYLRRWYGIERPSDTTINAFNLQDDFEKYMPITIASEMCDNHSTTSNPLSAADAPCFVSRVACLSDDGTSTEGCQTSDNIYLTTYGGLEKVGADYERPSWWPRESTSRARRYERWRRSFGTRTTSSDTCGTIFTDPNNSNKFCLDNGIRTLNNGVCTHPIPAGLISALFGTTTPVTDMFFCMSKVKQGPFAYYPANLTRFWDGLDNQNKHAPYTSTDTRLKGSASGQWLDLVNSYTAGSVDDATKAIGNLPASLGYFGPTDLAKLQYPAITLEGPSKEVALDITSDAISKDFTLTMLVGFGVVDENQSVNPVPQVDLLKFETSTEEIFKMSIKLNDEDEKTLYLTFDDTKTTPRIESAPFNVVTLENLEILKGLVQSITLRRDGNQLSVYIGKYIKNNPAYNANRSDLTSTFEYFKEDTNKVRIMNLGTADNQATRIYGVRFFDRALTTDEIYDMYKEDSRRFPMYQGTTFEDK